MPMDPSHEGIYPITVILTNGYSAPRFYQFKVTIEKNPQPEKPEIKKIDAKLKIIKITRDGLAYVKVIAPK
jgi:hypothetical protein